MNMHVKAELKLEAGKSYRGKSGAIHRVETNDNSAWPFKTADEDLGVSRFWKIDGSGYNTDGWNSRAMIGEDLVELAPRFAVGDKVRVVESVGIADIGATAVIGPRGYWKSDWGSEFVDIIWEKHANGQMNGGYYPDCFEPLPATYTSCAAAEVDNLAAEYGPFDDGGPYNEEKTKIRSLVDQFDVTKGKVYEVNEVDGKSVWITDDVGDDFYLLHSEFEHVAVAPATATLRIEAGRYYKTRDGRKVGPMVYHGVGKWPFSGSNGLTYTASGQFASDFREHRSDLVAEWQDEPAASTPTSIADIVRKHSGTAIVCLLENGQPKPSTLPFVHSSRSAAATEANRLAGVHKGKEFGVYECVDVKKVEKTYEHEWQRLAAGGSKIPAIKSYRDAGGKRQTFVAAEWGFPARYEDRHVIGLKEAKD
ncbi:hypothetical protein LB579_32630, partial [Mesorhizobium sp. BR1-1-7]|uniref:hypothetical protein n=1 Tax=Mesorhizobium sp. BR1-1-7 TaxID=2876647 RepID=UPI001CCDDA70